MKPLDNQQAAAYLHSIIGGDNPPNRTQMKRYRDNTGLQTVAGHDPRKRYYEVVELDRVAAIIMGNGRMRTRTRKS